MADPFLVADCYSSLFGLLNYLSKSIEDYPCTAVSPLLPFAVHCCCVGCIVGQRSCEAGDMLPPMGPRSSPCPAGCWYQQHTSTTWAAVHLAVPLGPAAAGCGDAMLCRCVVAALPSRMAETAKPRAAAAANR